MVRELPNDPATSKARVDRVAAAFSVNPSLVVADGFKLEASATTTGIWLTATVFRMISHDEAEAILNGIPLPELEDTGPCEDDEGHEHERVDPYQMECSTTGRRWELDEPGFVEHTDRDQDAGI